MCQPIKILAINGSPRHGSTFNILRAIEESLQTTGISFVFDVLDLSKAHITPCLGCCRCYEYHESSCPHQDDLATIQKKMADADGIIFATPTYVMNVSSIMKVFIDRLSYACHRSYFYNKEAMLVTTCAGRIGIKDAEKSLFYAVMSWGFHISTRIRLITGHYTTHQLTKTEKKHIDYKTIHFIKKIKQNAYKKPSITALIGFKYRQRCYQRAIQHGETSYDLSYWKDNGYLDKKAYYFFPIKISVLTRLLIRLLTSILTQVL